MTIHVRAGLGTGMANLWFVLVALLACSSITHGQVASSIAGVWVRAEDDYRGWVVEIYEDGSEEYAAKSLWVPEAPRILNGFQIGEKKMRANSPRSDGTYRIESLRRGDDGEPDYDVQEATLSTVNRLILIDDNSTGTIGDRQVWLRVRSDEVLMAYADYGRGRMALRRERFADAATAFERAALRLLKESKPRDHSSLANEIAWELATNRYDQILKPQLALKLVPALEDWYQEVDTAAAVYAANGDFATAIKLQQKALSEVSAEDAAEVFMRNRGLNDRNWMLKFGIIPITTQLKSEFSERLELYKQGRPYRD
jgi:hypothetical protein